MSRKFYYIANARIPTEKAHGHAIMKMCEGFAMAGQDLRLLLPFRFQTPQFRGIKDAQKYYKIKKRFKVRHIFSIDLQLFDYWVAWLPIPIFYLLQEWTFGAGVLLWSFFHGRKSTYYSRSFFVASLLSLFYPWKPVYFEVHQFPESKLGKTIYRIFLKRLKGVVAISKNLKEECVNVGYPADKILVATSGVDESFFKKMSKKEARKDLKIPADAKVVMYTGNLYAWKGVYTLAKASDTLPKNTKVYVVGGSLADNNINLFREFLKEEALEKVVTTGHKPPHEIPKYLAAADVLVLPNSASKVISVKHTSPLKLFEYMAAKRPIVASKLSSIEEVLNKDLALMVEPDDVDALAKGIKEALSSEQKARVEKAYKRVQESTWTKRAERVLTFVLPPHKGKSPSD